ncbi:MAG: hypothetical protein ACRYG5_15900 [Janthinobacterium lividum]
MAGSKLAKTSTPPADAPINTTSKGQARRAEVDAEGTGEGADDGGGD